MSANLLSLPQLSYLRVWLPREIKRGTLWTPTNPQALALGDNGDSEHPFIAVSRCPRCNEIILNRLQCAGMRPAICQSGGCSCEFSVSECDECDPSDESGREYSIKTEERKTQ
jgi:hypothetical protein